MKRMTQLFLASSLMVAGLSTQANALTFTYSGETKRIAPYLGFSGDYDLPLGLNISGGLGGTWDLSSFVSPLPADKTFQDQLDSDLKSGKLPAVSDLLNSPAFKGDILVDANLNLGYNFDLVSLDLGIGKLGVTLTPYAGWRHMFTVTTAPTANDLLTVTTLDPKELTKLAVDKARTANLGGLNYGARLEVGLPLGFSGYAKAGASSLLMGSMDQAGKSEPIKTNGTTLPHVGLGAAWNFPFFNLASIYGGYEAVFLPRDLRLTTDLKSGTVPVHTFNVGFRILFFGI